MSAKGAVAVGVVVVAAVVVMIVVELACTRDQKQPRVPFNVTDNVLMISRRAIYNKVVLASRVCNHGSLLYLMRMETIRTDQGQHDYSPVFSVFL